MIITKIKVIGLLAGILLVLAGTGYATPVINGSYNIGSGEYAWEYYDDGPLGPAGGGQAFDLELMGLTLQGNNLCFGLRTGFDLTNGSGPSTPAGPANQRAGDLFFDFDNDGFFEVAVRYGASGPLTEGGPTANVSMDLYTGYTAGDYIPISYPANTMWIPWSVDTTGLLPTSLTPGVMGRYDWSDGTTLPGHTDDNNLTYGDSSYVLEGCFDISTLWNGSDHVTFHWTMQCGNDGGNVTTPEPASVVMASLGIFGVIFGRRRLRKWLG